MPKETKPFITVCPECGHEFQVISERTAKGYFTNRLIPIESTERPAESKEEPQSTPDSTSEIERIRAQVARLKAGLQTDE